MFTKPAGIAVQCIGLLIAIIAATMVSEGNPDQAAVGTLFFLPAFFFLWLGRKVKK